MSQKVSSDEDENEDNNHSFEDISSPDHFTNASDAKLDLKNIDSPEEEYNPRPQGRDDRRPCGGGVGGSWRNAPRDDRSGFELRMLEYTSAADMIEFWRLNFITNTILNMSHLKAKKISDTMYWYWTNAVKEYD